MADDNSNENTLKIVAANLVAPLIATFDAKAENFTQSAITAYRNMLEAVRDEEEAAEELKKDASSETWRKLGEQI